LVLRCARIEESVSHGARGLRGRVATAWSFDLEHRFTGRKHIGSDQLRRPDQDPGETGCAMDVHFIDGTTAEAGLNNYVYTLKKL